ncbi:MAG: agmatine deiminase family protein [Prevotella sp.]|nr:agmatine deiminase family protein [Prevotella sp.]
MITEKAFRLPAEWEPQSGVQLTWPHRDTDWAPMLDEVLNVYHEIAREISRREPLLIVAPEGAAPGMVHVVCDTDDTWARDHGFITLLSVESSKLSDFSFADRSKVAQPSTLNSQLLDFKFNGWGEKFPAEQDNAINRRLYDVGAVKGEYVDHLDFVLEGGSIESDGRGTIFTTSQCLLAPHRNQPLTKLEIEQRLKDYLYAERVLWIDYGHLAGDDTDGHIDTLVRICPDDTLLYIKCDNTADEHYEDLRLMEEQLRSFRTLDGRPYRLLPLPMPHPIYDAEATCPQRLPATYANFLVINGAVLCPTYGQPEVDTKALDVIAQAFPGRDIVPIDCRPLIRQHGSLHCCTMQFPEGVIG